jgi:hypothetical protein
VIPGNLFGVVYGLCDESLCGFGPGFAQDGGSELESKLRDFAARLEDDELFAGD